MGKQYDRFIIIFEVSCSITALLSATFLALAAFWYLKGCNLWDNTYIALYLASTSLVVSIPVGVIRTLAAFYRYKRAQQELHLSYEKIIKKHSKIPHNNSPKSP